METRPRTEDELDELFYAALAEDEVALKEFFDFVREENADLTDTQIRRLYGIPLKH